MSKFATYVLRAVATTALAGAGAVADGKIPAVWGAVFTAVSFLCALFHAQPFDVTAFVKKVFNKTGAAVVLVAALAVGAAGCSGSVLPPTNSPMPPADGGAPDGAGFGYCVETGTRAAVLDIMPKVTAALATGQYEVELAVLGAEFGGPVVYCAALAVVNEFKTIKLDKPEPTVTAVLANGQAYLTNHSGK